MDEYLFYSYLAFKRQHELPIIKKLSRVSITGILLSVGTILFSAVACFSFLYEEYGIAFLSVIIALILNAVLDRHLNCMLMSNSDLKMERYCEYCKTFKAWLEGKIKFSVNSIEEIRNRTLVRIEEMKLSRKEFEERLDKWMQIIAVPIVLSLITYVINKDIDMTQKLSFTFSVLIIFLLGIWLLGFIKNMKWFQSKKMFNQLICFSEDLQGVLDIDLFEVK